MDVTEIVSLPKTTDQVGNQIKNKLLELSNEDGFKRTQRWLYKKIISSGIEMSETKLSNSISGLRQFTLEEKIAINKILGTHF
jgi:predicted transcriptional regulator